MKTKILEAFKNFKISPSLVDEVKDLFVEKIVVSNETKDVIIFISGNKPVRRGLLEELMLEIHSKVFKNSIRSVRFEERYDFSELSIEEIFNQNRENLMEEISREGDLCFSVFKKSRFSFDETTIFIEIEDILLHRVKMEYVREWMETVFCKRYAKEAKVKINYKKVEERKQTPEDSDMEFSTLTELQINRGKEGQTKKEEKTKSQPPKYAEGKGYQKKAGGGKYRKKLPDDPNVIYGRNFEGNFITLSEEHQEGEEVVARGQIIQIEEKELRSGKFLFMVDITDFTDSVRFKIFINKEDKNALKENLQKGHFIQVKGIWKFDSFEKEVSIASVMGIKKMEDFRKKRQDNSIEKRVELHLHTNMSEMDAIIQPSILLKTLSDWGHKAVAITDSGVVQSFTEANNHKKWMKLKDMKLIYGMEGNVVDDIGLTVRNLREQTTKDEAVVFDIETTGFGPKNSRIIEIGAVKVKDGKIVDRFSGFVNPHQHITKEITELTNITDEMVVNEPDIEVILPKFLEFCGEAILVAHNASFDTSFIYENMRRLGYEKDFTILDTLPMARILLGALKNYKLDTLAGALDVSLLNHHRAVHDAECTAEIYLKLCEILEERYGNNLLKNLNENKELGASVIKKIRPHPVTILAKNDIGRINLYHLVSLSHLDYFMKVPRIRKSDLLKYREGLLFGSSCSEGELFRALLSGHGRDEIERIVSFYDFLEIQPVENNRSLIERKREPDLQTEEDLRNINRKIVELGEKYGKPVVATSDAHFLHPEEEIYRKIIVNANPKNIKTGKKLESNPLYLRTTEEMLEEFSYLGNDKAFEVVVRNTNKIANMIDRISPVRPDKCAPVIANSDEELRSICENKAKEIYGEELPLQVRKRMNHELDSIIKNGFAVMYIISQKLVWKSNEDGYLVGSRGSVGSSFVAFLSGITEVNSLPAHYYCENCHFVDFDSEEVRAYSGRSGCDMPDRFCPECGRPLIKDGHDIPFETFLGFNGDKEPDIDLNFSGEYQAKAHAYTEVIFGEGQTYRAGTIGGVAERTAIGYVLKYNEENEIIMRRTEVQRISKGCMGVRRTTGQHPGGIVVLPIGEDICSFTPIQHPANDMETPIVTTHFDYHSIDHNLLKLDILGHDDPTMIRMLEDLTGVDAKQIRLDDQKVLSLFLGLDALGISPEELDGYDLGSLGIPEFGTDFVMQMLRDTKPKSFSDLVRISGLSHGTDVWTGNAQKLITEGICTISKAICTRDDIMIYLIDMGVEPGLSFKIMESVRKGKGLTPEWEAAMKEKNVPDWYIWSCKQIKYMFPKAHAAAYVMMGFRIAYFKVYHPLAYYAAYFSIRADAFDYEMFCGGKQKLQMLLNELNEVKRDKPDGRALSNKEEDIIKDGHIVLEMYARGFSFEPIDLYKAKPKQFQIIDGKIMPSLNSIDGLGDKAAYALYEAAKKGSFISKDDLRKRVKGLTQNSMEKMSELGILKNLPETNQISFLDFLTE